MYFASTNLVRTERMKFLFLFILSPVCKRRRINHKLNNAQRDLCLICEGITGVCTTIKSQQKETSSLYNSICVTLNCFSAAKPISLHMEGLAEFDENSDPKARQRIPSEITYGFVSGFQVLSVSVPEKSGIFQNI